MAFRIVATSLILGLAGANVSSLPHAMTAFNFKDFVGAVFDSYDAEYTGSKSETALSNKINITAGTTHGLVSIVNEDKSFAPKYLWRIQFDDGSNSTGFIEERLADVEEDELTGGNEAVWHQVCPFNWLTIGPEGAVSTSASLSGPICTGVAVNVNDATRAYWSFTVTSREGAPIRTLYSARRPLSSAKTLFQQYGQYIMIFSLVVVQMALKWYTKSPGGTKWANQGREAVIQRERKQKEAESTDAPAAPASASGEGKKDN